MKKNLLLTFIFYFTLIISSYGAGSSGSSDRSSIESSNYKFSDEKIIGGECSTPGIISLVGLCNNTKIRKKINLNEKSNVLLFGCEGDADEELYQKLLN